MGEAEVISVISFLITMWLIAMVFAARFGKSGAVRKIRDWPFIWGLKSMRFILGNLFKAIGRVFTAAGNAILDKPKKKKTH